MKKNCLIFPGLFSVWELVQSMSKREKLRLKETARLQGGKVPEKENDIAYVNFFNVLEAQKVYDKARIKEKLAGATTLHDLSDSCSYLYHAILRAMQAASDDVVAEVADVNTQIKILVYKGLNHHVQPIYDRAMVLAEETEDFEVMLSLMRLWKISLNNAHPDRHWTEDFEALTTLEGRIWMQLTNLHEWEHLFDLWVSLRRVQGEKREAIMRSITDHPLMQQSGPCLSIKASVVRLLICDRPITNLDPNQVERIPKLIEIATIIEGNPRLFEDTLMVNRYLNVVSSIGILGTIFKQEPPISLAVERMLSFGRIRKETDVLVFERVEEIRIIQIRNSGNFVDADETINRILDGLETYGGRVNRKRRVNFVLEIVEIYLLSNRPALAAKLLAPLLNQTPFADNPRPNILLWAYYLIAEHELGHTDIMKAWSASALKYLSMHQIEDEAGLAIIQFLRRLSSKNDLAKKKAEVNRFKKEVLPILSEQSNLYYCTRFPFEKWVFTKATANSSLYK